MGASRSLRSVASVREDDEEFSELLITSTHELSGGGHATSGATSPKKEDKRRITRSKVGSVDNLAALVASPSKVGGRVNNLSNRHGKFACVPSASPFAVLARPLSLSRFHRKRAARSLTDSISKQLNSEVPDPDEDQGSRDALGFD